MVAEPASSVYAPETGRWPRLAGHLGGTVLGLVLLVAAWTKMLDPLAFAELIRLEGLDAFLPATVVAFIALGLEVGLGLLLVSGVRRLWVLVPAALLVAFFLALTGRAWYLDAHGLRPEAASCGCFGNLVDRTPAEAFWQDLLLMVPALGLAFLGRPGGALPRRRLALAAVVTLAALLFAWRAPELPLDDLATRLKPGVEVAALCTGSGDERTCLTGVMPELAAGEHLVVITGLSDELGAAVDQINEHVFAGGQPPVVALTAAAPEDLTRFRFSYGPAFDIYPAPASLLQPLYRRLPRSFLVVDGRVERTYAGLPPVGGPAPEANTPESSSP